jgi:hypothetical protein
MTDAELKDATMKLHDQYNEVVKLAPPTDAKSFAEAQKSVQSGIHESDNP